MLGKLDSKIGLSLREAHLFVAHLSIVHDYAKGSEKEKEMLGRFKQIYFKIPEDRILSWEDTRQMVLNRRCKKCFEEKNTYYVMKLIEPIKIPLDRDKVLLSIPKKLLMLICTHNEKGKGLTVHFSRLFIVTFHSL